LNVVMEIPLDVVMEKTSLEEKLLCRHRHTDNTTHFK
jgi:hypothetical protein